MKKPYSTPASSNSSEVTKPITKYSYQKTIRLLTDDVVVSELPLQIRLYWLEKGNMLSKVFSITMRTPSNEEELILGMLLTEGLIKSYSDVVQILLEHDEQNQWEVKLASGIIPNLNTIDRYQLNYSSCGLCGTTSLKSLDLKEPPKLNDEQGWLEAEDIYLYSKVMQNHQTIFKQTGGVHAAALFSKENHLIALQEDIGRHNAVDKVIGTIMKNGNTHSLKQSVLVVSSRISFEIVQKAVMAGVPVLIAVGAPTDLAINAAKRFNLTLIGFATNQSFNLYHGQWRLTSLNEGS